MADIFDKIKKGVTKGLTTISVKTKEYADSNKVKSEISDLNKKRSNLIIEIGDLFYKMYKENSFNQEKLNEKCNLIDNIKKSITEKEELLKKIQEESKKQLAQSKEVQESKEDIDSKLICSNCKFENPEETKYCGNCGQKL